MPIIESKYKAPLHLSNAHTQTLYPVFFRKIKPNFDYRERITTLDDDFLDLDWVKTKSKKCVILSHGLEGHSKKWYISGMSKYLSQNGYDICAWNFRGCSGEENKTIKTYHSGFTQDLDEVVKHALPHYDEIYLVGFSMGGNLSLKYVGERGENLHSKIKKCVVFSVPTDLKDSCYALMKKSNYIYMKRFLVDLKVKLEEKKKLFPNEISIDKFSQVKSFIDFDNLYTAPLNGFKNSDDYCEKCSSKQFIPNITIPTLIVNALNDPFLQEKCYPIKECVNQSKVFLEMPKSGGHIAFISHGGVYYSEKRTLDFLLNTY